MKEIKLTGQSQGIVTENIKRLTELFPEIIIEDKIDFAKLQEILGNYVDDKEDSYRFTWHGKKAAFRKSQTQSTGTLRPCKEESKDWDTTQNLYIEGDNLEVLKLLQKSYGGKVKMIYIDPPYNKDRDFIYPDKWSDPVKEYKKITGQVDEEGNVTTSEQETEGGRHTNWLNMMYPRLRLARNLLTDDGALIISIDSIELMNLRKICDEIFGEENFLSIISIESATTASYRSINVCPVNVAEYLIMYRKSDKLIVNPIYRAVDYTEDYSHIIENFDEDSSKWQVTPLDDLIYRDVGVSNWKEFRKLKGNNWKSIRFALKREIAFQEKRRVVSLNTMQKPSQDVQDLIDVSREQRGNVFKLARENKSPIYAYNGRTLAFFKNKFKNVDGQVQPAEILTNVWTDISYLSLGREGNVSFLNGKKPISLIKRLCELCSNDGDLIMDFFSGSASTAHAVFQLNSMEKTSRKFILIQLPENLDILLSRSDPNTRKIIKNTIDFLDNISRPHFLTEIGKERIRRAGEEIKKELEEEKGEQLNNQISLISNQEQLSVNTNGLDIGFKVFKLDSSNLQRWDLDVGDEFYKLNNEDQHRFLSEKLGVAVNNYVDGRTEVDMVYEIMLKSGLDLALPVEVRVYQGVNIYSIGEGKLIICMDSNLTENLADYILRLINETSPNVVRVAVKDLSFSGYDAVKANFKATLENGVKLYFEKTNKENKFEFITI